MFLIYIIFFFLILRFTVTVFNFISNPKLTHSGKQHQDAVSVLIPVKNDESIINLIESIRGQNYKNYEVLISTTEATLKTCEALCKDDQRFKCVNIPELKSGWTEKNLVCAQLGNAATGKYLIFLDACTIVSNDLINNAVQRMKIQHLTLLSLFTNQLMLTIGEHCVVPLVNFLVLNLIPLRLVRLFKSPIFSITNSQFMMFDAKDYAEHEWHRLVKKKEVGDSEIMKLVKGRGFKAETLLANGFIYSRMYRGFTNSAHGFSNSIISNFGNSVTGMSIYIFFVILGPVAIAMYMSNELLLFAIGLIVLSRMMISLSSGQNPWLNILLHPLQMLSLIWVAILSVQKHFTKTKSHK
ncbi:MAG TPA: glycosyltransferase family 2 protein [Sphingobacteriaceae bacterium]|nr:glycosyltransferase family 2 protein [Sphingobacteriaceae bacterium]